MNPFKSALGVRPCFGHRVFGFLIVLLASLLPQIATCASPPVLGLAPGPIGVTSFPEASTISFDRPSAQFESASEGAGDAVAALLQTPQVGNPQIEAAIGILQFAATPFVAGYGAITAGHRKLDSDQLDLFERQLTAAMIRAAEQENLRQSVLAAASDITHRQLIDLGATNAATSSRRLFSGLLETRIRNIEVKRSEKGDRNYILCIAAEARLLSLPDCAVLSQQHFNYRSDKAMFIDWAREGGLENVATTAFRLLGYQIAQAFFSSESATPLVVGTGWPQAVKQRSNSSAQRTESAKVAALLFLMEGVSSFDARNDLRLASLNPHVVDYRFETTASFEVLPDVAHPEVFIRGPKGQLGASPQTLTDTEWALDGLENHRNFVVQAAACIAAIPMGLWEHTVGALGQHSHEDLQAAQSFLERLTWKRPVQQILGNRIAQSLAAQSSQRVFLRKLPLIPSEELSATQFVQPGSFGAGPPPQGRETTSADTTLQVRVSSIVLDGTPRRHSGMHLALEAEVTLLRTSDGQELCSFPVSYRGASRKLANWSDKEGLLLKQELEACSIQTADTLVRRLISDGYVIPARTTGGTLARK